ncbi:hypothetical protein HHI36_000859 [Cryptolaemus montrouzieri]|uniref:Nucleolar protein 6 n=1 Tax=Cryptolaemus montrouzieri TaxID=559131 RepID=A0ABD2P624_9CUCU
MEVLDQVNEDEFTEGEMFETDQPLKRPSDFETPNGRKKIKMKQPTVEELNELNETQTLFNNNLFRLQIQELLAATKIKNKHKEKLTSWVDNFQLFLNTLPVHDAINISKFSKKSEDRPSRDQRFIKNITNQCRNNLHCDQDIPITLVRPDCMSTFGLFKIDSLPGPNLTINIQLTVPKKCFHVKDFLNNRYSVKKFFYLMYIAEHLKSNNICSSIKCAYYYENILLPYLIVVPNNSDKIFINIFVVPEQNYFKGQRFLPDVNNVRAPVFEQNLPLGEVENLVELPTPFYNAALGFDVTLTENNIFIQQTLSNLSNVQEGLKLIIVWMNQRMFNEGKGAFSNDIIIYIISYLVLKKKINKHMSSYQVFRNFLNFMNTTDLSQTSISICENISEEILQKFKNAFDIVIVDSTGFYNVAAFLNISVYKKMRTECQLAFSALDQDTLSSFSNLFLVKVPLYLQYDGIIDLKSENNYQSILKNIETTEKVAYLGNHTLLIMKYLQNYLKKGLNNRVLNIVPISPNHTTWDYGVHYKMTNQRLLFGIQLDPDCAFDILEFGPNLNDPKEKEFKEFWGKLASNRRFRDGTAKVVVHFDKNTIKGKREIIREIVNFIMIEKLKLNFKFYYDEFEEVLVNDKVDAWYPSGTNEETTVKIIRSSDELGRKIRALGMQLGITGIGGISDVYCYTDIFPPIPTSYHSGKSITSLKEQHIILKEKKLHAAPKYVKPIECAIHLEHSSKWPGELNALQKMKTLFYLEISKMLLTKYKITSSVKPSYMDVLYEGIVFRYTLYLSKEIALLKREKLGVLPKIIGALKGIQSQFPAYGISTCLAKRWIRAHLIDDYLFPDILINLLNAHQFLSHSLYNPAVSPQVAFLRFLKYITEVSWDLEPVVINFNNELTSDQISNLDSRMRTNRESFPPLFILTPYDNGDSIFTKKAPSKEVLVRLKVLANECLNVVQNILLQESLFSIKELFIPNTNGFNCILNLRSLTNPRKIERIIKYESDSKIHYREPCGDDKCLPVIDFDPIQMYLRDLRNTYGTFCVFFMILMEEII